MTDRNLILLRGVSGAGKSTVAGLFIDATIISTDDFFMKDGEYQFDGNSLIENHMKCTIKAEQTMQAATKMAENTSIDMIKHTLVIHNTFTKQWEMTPYLILAEKYGYTIHTIIVENRHESKSIHDVPQASIDAQRDRFDIVL